jgi:hypothetical protein
MDSRLFPAAQTLVSGIALLLISMGTGCKSVEEPRAAQVKWFAHCDTCNWCKGSFKTSQEAQEIVTNHNKVSHDWFRIAYYSQVKCP